MLSALALLLCCGLGCRRRRLTLSGASERASAQPQERARRKSGDPVDVALLNVRRVLGKALTRRREALLARVERWHEVREVQMLVSLSVVQLALYALFAAHVIGTASLDPIGHTNVTSEERLSNSCYLASTVLILVMGALAITWLAVRQENRYALVSAKLIQLVLCVLPIGSVTWYVSSYSMDGALLTASNHGVAASNPHGCALSRK